MARFGHAAMSKLSLLAGGRAEDICSEGDGRGPPAKRLLAH